MARPFADAIREHVMEAQEIQEYDRDFVENRLAEIYEEDHMAEVGFGFWRSVKKLEIDKRGCSITFWCPACWRKQLLADLEEDKFRIQHQFCDAFKVTLW